MGKRATHLLMVVLLCISTSCSKNEFEEALGASSGQTPNTPETPENPEQPEIKSSPIAASAQRVGNAQAGYEYLTTGNYMASGVPFQAFLLGFGESTTNVLQREGDNAKLPYDYNAVLAENGVKVVGPNCMQCHASTLNGEFIMGLGSHNGDFTFDRSLNSPILEAALLNLYGSTDSPEYQAYAQFGKSIKAIGPNTITKSRGVNPADKITKVLVAHRDKDDLSWVDDPKVTIDPYTIPTDVPAWWLLKKKNAMFYHGLNRKDFGKAFIGSSLLTMSDKVKAEEVDLRVNDILAYIYSLEAPEYPYEIDQGLADTGKVLFENNCSSCHGTYGSNESYPNLLVALESIGTDPALSNDYSQASEMNDYFLDWFNTGWFAQGDAPIALKGEGGYVAPPLDGIWATAPYLHNASVPTLADVLDSKNRPTYWSRTFDDADYDSTKVGWNYKVESSQTNKNTYNTTLVGYGNEGHTFGDVLSDTERKAVLEYLKTL
ncbi:c-type cytochrome [Sediminicola luteus]|uniref:Cytochrome c domain-containing protein n=1 Tax=Sediminicola luteus TaxID=319238 RepID=A0A2A4G581_9FLAO|nr:c-type cytochrome [Sediminicola luteus]PCE63807.1 hypothetical protein B7P33_11090 [Sediminicola luteus]